MEDASDWMEDLPNREEIENMLNRKEDVFDWMKDLESTRKERFGMVGRKSHIARIKRYSLKQQRLMDSIDSYYSKLDYLKLLKKKRQTYKFEMICKELALLNKLYSAAKKALDNPGMKAQLGAGHYAAARHIVNAEHWISVFDQKIVQFNQEFLAVERAVKETRWEKEPIIDEHKKLEELEQYAEMYEKWSEPAVKSFENALEGFRQSRWYSMLNNAYAGIRAKAQAGLCYALVMAATGQA